MKACKVDDIEYELFCQGKEITIRKNNGKLMISKGYVLIHDNKYMSIPIKTIKNIEKEPDDIKPGVVLSIEEPDTEELFDLILYGDQIKINGFYDFIKPLTG